MKIEIIDAEALRRVRLFQAGLFLTQHGWREDRPFGRKGMVWRNPLSRGKAAEILLPTDPSVDDYAERIGDAIRLIADAQSRSGLSVYRDMLTADADLLRLRLISADAADGAVPADLGVALFQGARDLIMAGACSAISPLPAHPNRKPEQASQYIRKVKFGQTEEGSFVVTVLSILPPQYTAEGALIPEGLPKPFERRAVETTVRAVDEIRRVLDAQPASLELEAFRRAVPAGVSANLCSALSTLLPPPESQSQVDLRVSWSVARDSDQTLEKVASFSPREGQLLAEAAQKLRDEAPRPDFELIGTVVRLEREKQADPGKIVVTAFVDGAPKHVSMILAEEEAYSIAIYAHEKYELFRVQGTLAKLARGWELLDPVGARLFTSVE